MHIPRQPDGPRGPCATRRDGATGADGLRARRQHLVGQLRTVTYWQRLVQARVDLVVAGLLYGSPVPPTPPWTGSPAAADLQALAAPPEGLDVCLLVGHAPVVDGGPGAHLERLQQASVLLAVRRRLLEEDLDVVTLALHDRLAADGAEDADRPAGTMSPLVTGPTA